MYARCVMLLVECKKRTCCGRKRLVLYIDVVVTAVKVNPLVTERKTKDAGGEVLAPWKILQLLLGLILATVEVALSKLQTVPPAPTAHASISVDAIQQERPPGPSRT